MAPASIHLNSSIVRTIMSSSGEEGSGLSYYEDSDSSDWLPLPQHTRLARGVSGQTTAFKARKLEFRSLAGVGSKPWLRKVPAPGSHKKDRRCERCLGSGVPCIKDAWRTRCRKCVGLQKDCHFDGKPARYFGTLGGGHPVTRQVSGRRVCNKSTADGTPSSSPAWTNRLRKVGASFILAVIYTSSLILWLLSEVAERDPKRHLPQRAKRKSVSDPR